MYERTRSLMEVFFPGWEQKLIEAQAEVQRIRQEIVQLEMLRNNLRVSNDGLQLDIAAKTQKLANICTILVNLAIATATTGLVGLIASAAVYMKAQKEKSRSSVLTSSLLVRAKMIKRGSPLKIKWK